MTPQDPSAETAPTNAHSASTRNMATKGMFIDKYHVEPHSIMEAPDFGALFFDWFTDNLFRIGGDRRPPPARPARQPDPHQRRIEARRAEHAARAASRRLDTLLQRRRPDAIFVLELVIPGLSTEEAAPRGLDASAVEARTTKETVSDELANTGEQCTVCLEQLENEQPARRLACRHIYHLGCIDKWFEIGTRCPNCNTEV